MQTADVEFGNVSNRYVMKTWLVRRKSTNAKVITTATAVRLVIKSFALQKALREVRTSIYIFVS